VTAAKQADSLTNGVVSHSRIVDDVGCNKRGCIELRIGIGIRADHSGSVGREGRERGIVNRRRRCTGCRFWCGCGCRGRCGCRTWRRCWSYHRGWYAGIGRSYGAGEARTERLDWTGFRNSGAGKLRAGYRPDRCCACAQEGDSANKCQTVGALLQKLTSCSHWNSFDKSIVDG